jgi:hypothetical protein
MLSGFLPLVNLDRWKVDTDADSDAEVDITNWDAFLTKGRAYSLTLTTMC